MKPSVAGVSLLLALSFGPPAVADPLDFLDPTRYGAGTILSAMEQLEEYLPSQALEPLKVLLLHPDLEVAQKAARLLRRMGQSAEGATVAAAALADAGLAESTHLAAAVALGELRDAGAVGPLATALTSAANEKVRVQAALSLGRLGRAGNLGPLQQAATSDPSALVRLAAVRALAALPDTTAEQLVDRLEDDEATVRREAAWALGQKRFAGQSAAVGRLTLALQQDKDCRVRAAAAWALGALGDATARPALEAVSEHPCRLAAQAAGWALFQLK